MRKTFQKNTRKESKAQKRNMIIFSVFMIFLLVSSTAAFVFSGGFGSGNNPSIREFGEKFTQRIIENQQVWESKASGDTRYYLLLPSQVEYIEVDSQAISAVQQSDSFGIIFAEDVQWQPTFNYALLALNEDYYDSKTVFYGSLNETNSFELPHVTCANASAEVPMIKLAHSNQSGVTFENNCITITGETPLDFVSATEKLRLQLHGVDFTKNIDE